MLEHVYAAGGDTGSANNGGAIKKRQATEAALAHGLVQLPLQSAQFQ